MGLQLVVWRRICTSSFLPSRNHTLSVICKLMILLAGESSVRQPGDAGRRSYRQPCRSCASPNSATPCDHQSRADRATHDGCSLSPPGGCSGKSRRPTLRSQCVCPSPVPQRTWCCPQARPILRAKANRARQNEQQIALQGTAFPKVGECGHQVRQVAGLLGLPPSPLQPHLQGHGSQVPRILWWGRMEDPAA